MCTNNDRRKYHLVQSAMMQAASYMSGDYEQSTTPLVPNRHLLRPRNLTKEENMPQQCSSKNWMDYRNAEEKNWEDIRAPQYIDFFDIPETHESFFDRTVIASTPRSNNARADSSIDTGDETLVDSIHNITISKQPTDYDQQEICDTTYLNNNKENVQHEAVQNIVCEDAPVRSNNRLGQKPIPTRTKPFNLEFRQKQKPLVKEEIKPKAFKANPVPRFIKERLPFISKKRNTDQIQNTVHSGRDENENEEQKEVKKFQPYTVPKSSKEQLPSTSKKSTVKQEHNINVPEKPLKKTIEVWKRKPFIPRPAQRNTERPKTPPLSTSIRAKERKRFDEAIKKKEREEEQKKQKEELERKQREKEEMTQLRKLTVHKAQPIPKYKSNLPLLKKRPLTDPITPRLLKRRRPN